MNPTLQFDLNPDGSLRKTRNGYHRFTLVLNDESGPAISIKGFRVTKPYMRLQLPISAWKNNVFSNIELRQDLEARILAGAKARILEDEARIQEPRP